MESGEEGEKTFLVEDTSENCYIDVINALLRRGWKKHTQRHLSAYNLKKQNALARSSKRPQFTWTINENDANFKSLDHSQLINHFEGISTLTTKMGLVNILRDMPWIECNSLDIAPSDTAQRDEFVNDFRCSAAANIIKYSLHGHMYISTLVQDLAIAVISSALSSSDVLTTQISDDDWNLLLATSYQLSESNTVLPPLTSSYTIKASSRYIRMYLLMQAYRYRFPQDRIDGHRNIWIVKAPAACRGCGIKLMYRLSDILQSEKVMSGRTVQKYIESPHLLHKPMSQLKYKYDLRVWCLVTSFYPLEAYAFTGVYGRQCAIPYTNYTQSLGDLLIHLTNYSLQKQHVSDDDARDDVIWVENIDGLDAIEPVVINSHVSKLRNTVAKPTKVTKKELLVSHAKLCEQIGGSASDGYHVWKQSIWPKIKLKMLHILQATASFVSHRQHSFEFLGFDVLLDEEFEPWVLEVNMSPAMAHRNEEQSALIECMVEQMIDIILKKHGLHAHSTVSRKLGQWEALIPGDTSAPHKLIHSRSAATTECLNLNNTHAPRLQRPKSASGRRPISSATRTDVEVSRIDLCAVGKRIHVAEIHFADLMCNKFSCVLLLQRWARRFLERLRLYHHKRWCASVTLQCATRQHQARVLLYRLYVNKCTRMIQQCISVFVWKCRLHQRMLNRMAVRIQCTIRQHQSRQHLKHLRCVAMARVITEWYRNRREIYRLKAVVIIIRHVRKWYNLRFNKRVCIQKWYKIYYWRRKRPAIRIMRFLRRIWWKHIINHRIVCRRVRQLQQLAGLLTDESVALATSRMCDIIDTRIATLVAARQEKERKELEIQSTILFLTRPSDYDTKMSSIVNAYQGKQPVINYNSTISPYKRSSVHHDVFDINDFISKYEQHSDDDDVVAVASANDPVENCAVDVPVLDIEISRDTSFIAPELSSYEMQPTHYTYSRDEIAPVPAVDSEKLLEEEYQEYDTLMANFFEKLQYSSDRYNALKKRELKRLKRKDKVKYKDDTVAKGVTPETPKLTSKRSSDIDESEQCISICPCGKGIHVVGHALCWDCLHPPKKNISRPPSAGRVRPGSAATQALARPKSANAGSRNREAVSNKHKVQNETATAKGMKDVYGAHSTKQNSSKKSNASKTEMKRSTSRTSTLKKEIYYPEPQPVFNWDMLYSYETDVNETYIYDDDDWK